MLPADPRVTGLFGICCGLWRLTAAAYSEPGFGARLAGVREAVRSGSLEGSVPVEEVVPDWPGRLNRRLPTGSGSMAALLAELHGLIRIFDLIWLGARGGHH